MKLQIFVFLALLAMVMANYCNSDSDCGKKLAKCKKSNVICRCKKTFCTAKLKCNSDAECPPVNKCQLDHEENSKVCVRQFQRFRG